jgi:hypothetical protein
VFLPGDTLIHALASEDVARVAYSPLLFQGGNVLRVDTPGGGKVLLIGEAEVYRNVALGLSQEEAVDAFRVEFGVDRCVVVAAVGYHLDMFMNVRRVGGEVLAFLPDEVAAARIVVAAGVKALSRSGVIDEVGREVLFGAIEEGLWLAVYSALIDLMNGYRDEDGALNRAFVEALAGNEVGAGMDTRRFLTALDVMVAGSLRESDLEDGSEPVAIRRYFASIKRRAADLNSVTGQLEELGLRVVRVPSFLDAETGVSYVNGIHTQDAYWAPEVGGLLSELDEAAMGVFEKAVGEGVEVEAVRTNVIQGMYGGVHCMASAYFEE